MQLPARTHQTRMLSHALQNPYSPPIFLHGPPATAKAATLTSALPADFHQTHIDCVLSHNDRLLFSSLLGRPTTSDACDLVSALRDAPPGARAFIFHRAERLAGHNFSSVAVAALFRLPDLCGRPEIRLVFISRTPWHLFRAAVPHALPSPITVFFPPYTEPDVVTLIAAAYDPARLTEAPPPRHAARAKQAYPAYVKSVVSVLYPTTADVHELRRVCDDLYPDYILSDKPPAAAFNLVQDRLRRSLHTLYNRHVIPREQQLGAELAKRRKDHDLATRKDLSRAALTLLVAAFLAARNPPNHDVRYFTLERTRRSRGRGGHRGKRHGASRGGFLAVSRVFSLERLLAIFAAVRVDDVDVSAALSETNVSSALSTSCLVQISTLVGLGFLAREGGGDPVAEPKYRSNVTEEQAIDIANSLGIEIHQYWHKE